MLNYDDLESYDKHKVYSQSGALIALVSEDSLEEINNVPVSFLDWRSRASKRVFHSTFGAESGAALEAIGMANYMRAYLCDILLGHAQHVQVDEFNETHTRIVLLTDCRSLFDHLVKDGSVPDDRWVAVNVAALRCVLSAGPGRDKIKVECK